MSFFESIKKVFGKSSSPSSAGSAAGNLQARAKAFLDRPVPQSINYVPGSLSEQLIAEFAATGTVDLDAELFEMLQICVFEAENAASTQSGDAAAYFSESHEILNGILERCQPRQFGE